MVSGTFLIHVGVDAVADVAGDDQLARLARSRGPRRRHAKELRRSSARCRGGPRPRSSRPASRAARGDRPRAGPCRARTRQREGRQAGSACTYAARSIRRSRCPRRRSRRRGCRARGPGRAAEASPAAHVGGESGRDQGDAERDPTTRDHRAMTWLPWPGADGSAAPPPVPARSRPGCRRPRPFRAGPRRSPPRAGRSRRPAAAPRPGRDASTPAPPKRPIATNAT